MNHYRTQQFRPPMTPYLDGKGVTTTPNIIEKLTYQKFMTQYGYLVDIPDPILYQKKKISPFGVIYNAEARCIEHEVVEDNHLYYHVYPSDELTDVGDLILMAYFRIRPSSVRYEYQIRQDPYGIFYITDFDFTFSIPERADILHFPRRNHFMQGSTEFITTKGSLLVSKEGAIYNHKYDYFLQHYIKKSPDNGFKSIVFPGKHSCVNVNELSWRGWTELKVPKGIEICSCSDVEIDTRIEYLRPFNHRINNLRPPFTTIQKYKVRDIVESYHRYITECREHLADNGVTQAVIVK